MDMCVFAMGLTKQPNNFVLKTTPITSWFQFQVNILVRLNLNPYIYVLFDMLRFMSMLDMYFNTILFVHDLIRIV